MKKILVNSSLFIALSLTSCSSVSVLDKTAITGSDFNAELARNYKGLADYEAKTNDWRNSSHFAHKGLKAVEGHKVMPDDPYIVKNYPYKAELIESGKRLQTILTDENKNLFPKVTADALAFYDCWLEASQEEHISLRVNFCKDGFEVAMNTLATQDTNHSVEIGKLEQYIPPEDFVLFFELNSCCKLLKGGEELIARIASTIKSIDNAKLVRIRGFADASGPHDYNIALSLRRAEHVKSVLVSKYGLSENLIKVEALGDDELAYPTESGKVDARNRRVQIDIFQ